MISLKSSEGGRMNLQKLYISAAAAEAGINPTNVLTFRPLGKEVRDELLNKIRLLPPGCVVDLDFTGVEICDVSFVDEIVLEVQSYLIGKIPDKVIMISNVSEATLENLKAALAWRDQRGTRLQILQSKDGVLTYIGKLERNLDETLKVLFARKKITAREIAELNGIAINSASNRLKKLYDHRLVLREEIIDNSGKQHFYFLP